MAFLTNYRFWNHATISEKGMILNLLRKMHKVIQNVKYGHALTFDMPTKAFSQRFTKID